MPATPSDRNRNRRKLEGAEGRLGQLERQVEMVIFYAGRLHREMHGVRGELRETLGLEELPPVAPLYEAAAEFEPADGVPDDG